ncbi:hypothetical protein ACIGEP_04850 [Microbacterium sp. NPDC077663]|uniref:hypothetical protein n=1 Tax=Microbacterium sp. NPDC077663 TaxID=3364189 RepID=UPI0037C7905A
MGQTDAARGVLAAVVGVAVTALMGSCASYPIPRAPDGDPILAARALSDAPDVVRAGDAERSCGAFVLGQGEELPQESLTCLVQAANAGQHAELSWSSPTTEGDPIVSFAFTAEGGDVTVYETNAFDSYGGGQTWTQTSCAAERLSPVLGCTSLD